MAAGVVVATWAAALPVGATAQVGGDTTASTPSVVLDFEDVSGPAVKQQYAVRGVTFDPEAVLFTDKEYPRERGPDEYQPAGEARRRFARSPDHLVAPGPERCESEPAIAAAPARTRRLASGPGTAVALSNRGRQAASTSAPCEALTMHFRPHPASRVVVPFNYTACLFESTSVRLQGFDGERPVGSVVEKLPPNRDPRVDKISLDFRPSGPVSRATVAVEPRTAGSDCPQTNAFLIVDDVEFEAPVAAVDPPLVEFGRVEGSATASRRSVRVTSTGLTDLVVQRRPVVTGADAGDFTVVKEDCSARRLLPPRATCTVDVAFTPTTTGARNAVLQVFTNDPKGPTRTPLRGSGASSASTATVAPARLDFGQARVGEAGATRAVTVTAATRGGTLDVRGVTISPPTGDFSLADAACDGTTLKAGTSCIVEVRFRPGAVGPREAVLEVAAGTPRTVHRVDLVGEGTEAPVPSATLIPDPLDFGGTKVGGDPPVRTLTLTNPGTAPLAVDGVDLAGPNRGDFTVAGDRCSRSRVAPQAACTLEVRFRPGAPAPRAAVLAVRTNAADSPHEVALRGSGVTVGGVVEERPTISVSPGSGARGADVTVTGSGFSGRTELSWHSEPPGTRLAVVVPDTGGRIDLTVVVPADTSPGGHEVVACDGRGVCTRAPFTVELRSSPVAAGRGRLALLLVALVAMAVLVPAAVALFRRRRPAPSATPGPPPRRPTAGAPPPGGPDEPTRRGPGGVPRPREVRTGFSPAGDYRTGLDPSEALAPGRPYHFWVELGPATPTVPGARAGLTVALFDFPGELEVDPAADTGDLELRGDGSAAVARQGGLHMQARPGDELLGRRMFFRVRTPPVEGRHRLRCSLYSQQVLVQSWLVSAEVRRRPAPRGAGADPGAKELDYVLSRSLDPAALARLRPHRLSLMLNDNDEGTHGLRLLGEAGFKSSTTFDVAELAEHGNQVRRALRRVACGEEEETDRPDRYLYDGRVDVERLRRDLGSLARRGYRVYSGVVHDLARGAPGPAGTVDRLAELLRRPGRIQLSNRRGARHSLPAALVYDRPLDDAIGDLELCPAFVDALSAPPPLGDSACFRGECPTLGEPDVVCPSGFWGFRHVIGAPPSLGDAEAAPLEATLEVAVGDGMVVDVGVSTDPGFVCRAVHEDVLRSLHPRLEWNYGDTRSAVLKLLKSTQPHLVYFYCHGGFDEASGVPFIEVGPPGETPITGSNLLAYRVVWDRSHPLVMINGCHTSALGPQIPLELVSAFVEHSQAAGVIGTEITVFEPLACEFAELLLRRVLADGVPVGDAVREARLALLQRGNPLGLAYVAYAPADLRITEAAVAVGATAR